MLATSPTTRECRPEGNSAICALSVLASRPTRMQDTPLRARERVMPRPMPREAPVMSAVLPARTGTFMDGDQSTSWRSPEGTSKYGEDRRLMQL